MFCTWSVRVCVQNYAIVRHGVSGEIGPNKINKLTIFSRYFLGLAFWAECFVPNVILEHCPCQKTTCFAPHSALSQWHMSTNGPYCKKPTWKNTFPTTRFFDHTRVKKTYFTVAPSLLQQADELARALPSFKRPLLSLDVTVSKASNEIPSNRSTFMHPIRALFFLLCLRHEKYGIFVGVQLSQMLLLPEF